MMTRITLHLLLVLACLMTAACNTATVKTANPEQIIRPALQISEEQLLDVGIGIFHPGVDAMSKKEQGVYPKIRAAEARFMPFKLMETLQQSGNWGIVRVIPDQQSEMDVWVDAEILKSDGETLTLQVSVKDASGRKWYNKRYSEVASKYSYDHAVTRGAEPFQGIYNKIANDMLQYYKRLSAEEIAAIRLIAELKFAQRFSPEAFGNHLAVTDRGAYSIIRLPADDDPTLQRIKQIRERDYLFVDTMQEYYGTFVRQMEDPYREWRKAYYEEGQALREVKAQANRRLIGGALAVLGGILAQGVDSRTAQAAGAVGIGAGATAVMSGLNKREEAKVHSEALEEISASLDAEIEPHTIGLENRTVTLSGSVNEQYAQWQQILKDIYASETGQTGTAGLKTNNRCTGASLSALFHAAYIAL